MNKSRYIKQYGMNLASAVAFRRLSHEAKDKESAEVSRGFMRVCARRVVFYRGLLLDKSIQ